jgi:hypothetical protein
MAKTEKQTGRIELAFSTGITTITHIVSFPWIEER